MEVTLALALTCGVTAVAYHMLATGRDDDKARQLAWQQQTLAKAARRYMVDNYAALHASSGMAAFTEATDNAPSVRAIAPSRYLPPMMPARNSAGRNSCLLMSPSAGNQPLKALLITRGPDGQTPDRALAEAAARAMSESTGVVTGLAGNRFTATAGDGTWQITVTQPAYANDASDGGCAAMLDGQRLTLAQGDLVTNLTVDDPGIDNASQALWRVQDTSAPPGANQNTLLTTTTVRTDADGQGELAFYPGTAPDSGTATASTDLGTVLPDATHPESGRTPQLHSQDLLSVDTSPGNGGTLRLPDADQYRGLRISTDTSSVESGLTMLSNAVLSWGNQPLVLRGGNANPATPPVVIVHPGIRIAPAETQGRDPASGFRDIGKTRILTIGNVWKDYDQVRATDLARWRTDTPASAMEMDYAPCPTSEWGTLLPIKDTPQVAICLPSLSPNTVPTAGSLKNQLTGRWYFLAMSTIPLNSKDVRDGVRWMASSQLTGIGNRGIDPDGFLAKPSTAIAAIPGRTPANEELWSLKGAPLWPVRMKNDKGYDE